SQILRINNDYFLRDLDSRNGTLVNGQQIRNDVPLRLADNDLIQLGDILFVFQGQSIGASSPERGTSANRMGEAVAGMSISESDEVWPPPMAATETRTVLDKKGSGASVHAECWRLREALTANHVRAEYPPEMYAKLQEHLRDPDSKNRRILAKG